MQTTVNRACSFAKRRLRPVPAVAVLLLSVTSPVSADINHPFGSHPLSYAAGSVLPSHVSPALLDQAVRDFYDAWKATYVEQDCGNGRYYVRASTDPANLTVSEAHGYGMIISALMAGHDADAQTVFDGMFAYFRDHPSSFNEHLMSFYQNKSCNNAQGDDSASDGDLDIAYALLLADKQWGSCGAIDYLAEAHAVIADIKLGDLDPGASYVLLGDWVSPGSPPYDTATRSSDFLLGHYRSFLDATLDADWTGLVDATYSLIYTLQTGVSAATGLLPDFVVDVPGTPAPASPGFLEGPNDGAYYFNACRTPWRIATDFLVSAEPRAKTAVQAMTAWVRSESAEDPSAIRAGYTLAGGPAVDSDFLSMAFVAPLGVAAMVDAGNQAWLNDVWDLVVATPISAEGYYENTLKLLSMVVMSGNWLAPQSVGAPTCTPTGNALCTNPATIFAAQVRLKKAGGDPGRQKLDLRGSAFFAAGHPASLVEGLQIRVEDTGSGDAAIFDLTEASATAVGPDGGPVCDPRDRWKLSRSGTKATYKNKSGAVDAPTCSTGSANGLSKVSYKVRSSADLEFRIKTKRSTIAAPLGPLRATLVFGADAGAGAAGECAVSVELDCSVAGATLRCE